MSIRRPAVLGAAALALAACSNNDKGIDGIDSGLPYTNPTTSTGPTTSTETTVETTTPTETTTDPCEGVDVTSLSVKLSASPLIDATYEWEHFGEGGDASDVLSTAEFTTVREMINGWVVAVVPNTADGVLRVQPEDACYTGEIECHLFGTDEELGETENEAALANYVNEAGATVSTPLLSYAELANTIGLASLNNMVGGFPVTNNNFGYMPNHSLQNTIDGNPDGVTPLNTVVACSFSEETE